MNSREYFQKVQAIILAAPHVIQLKLAFDEVSEDECYIQGSLALTGGFDLFVAEYVVTQPDLKRLKYRYHLQTKNEELVARRDNAPHHPDIMTHPDHLHLGQGDVKPSPAMDIESVLVAVLPFMARD